MSELNDELSETCSLCQQPATGLASIGNERYCHEGPDPTCYMIAQWAEHVPILGNVGDWLIDHLREKDK